MSSLAFASVETWEYRDIAAPISPAPKTANESTEKAPPRAPGFTEEQVAERVRQTLQAEQQRWASEADTRETDRKVQFATMLAAFAQERARYFQHVEAEVVQLALAIARKILHREAELDPTLLGALVRIALDRMGASPAVRLRLSPADLSAWQREITEARSPYNFDLTADPEIEPGDCVVETDLGTAHFGFEAQLKEIEQGLLDLLAHRPGAR